MPEPVETVADVDGLRIHRFQVVRERREGDGGDGAGPDEADSDEADGDEAGEDVGDGYASDDHASDGREEWIVVGFGDGEVHLADGDFERTKTVPTGAFLPGRFEPLAAGGVPVWGY